MTDWNETDPTYNALLDWIASQSKTTAGKPQYGAAQQKNLTSFLSLANNPLLGVLSGGYDPMTYVPQYQDQGQGQDQVPFGATDYAVNAYKQRYGSNQTIQDLFNQADQGADQASLNALIDNADPNDVASWGVTPEQAKAALNGYYNAKADQAQAQAKYQYGLDAGSSGGGGGGAPTGANGYGADGLPSKSNYFGIDPTLGAQLQEYVPPEIQQQRDNALQSYYQQSLGTGRLIDQSNQNFDQRLANEQQQAASQDQQHENALLALVNGGKTPGSEFAGMPGVHQLGVVSPDYQNAAQVVDNQSIDPEDLVGYFAKANAAASGGKAHKSGGESSVSAFLADLTGDKAKPKLWDSNQGDTWDLNRIRGIATGPGGKQATVRSVFDQLTDNGNRTRRNRDRLNAMQDYAANRQNGHQWAQQDAQRRADRFNSLQDDLRALGGYQPQTVLQHNLQQRIGTLMSLGLG